MAIHNLVLGSSKEAVMDDNMTPTSCSPQRQFILHMRDGDIDLEVTPTTNFYHRHFKHDGKGTSLL